MAEMTETAHLEDVHYITDMTQDYFFVAEQQSLFPNNHHRLSVGIS